MRLLPHTIDVLAHKAARRMRLGCSRPHAFSQEGEDMILARLFEGRATGFYVDVGAHDPIRLSNTYLFYLRGWRGINVDAMPNSMKKFEKLRPEDVNVEALVSNQRQQLKFFIFNDPALNTCDPELVRQRDGLGWYRVIGTQTLESQALAEVLDKHIAPGQGIDFLSVDVEGMDLDVLRSNDWRRFRPTVVLAEDFGVTDVTKALESPVALFLKENGYGLFAKTVNTLIFRCDNSELA